VLRVSVVVLLASAIACTRERTQPPEDRALAEFAGSYPAEATPIGNVHEVEIVAAPTALPLVDGKQLQVWAYNGTVPGPTIRIRLGQTLRVRFTNRLPQDTTIHWHGVRVPNAMDGVPNLTQPPVKPGGTFVYEFTPKDAGTFWFHPHMRASEQVERGLYGVLIVEDPQPAPYSREVVWVLDDWLLDGSTGQIFEQFNTRHDLAHDGRWGNAITINGATRTALKVRPGERIRLRMLNSANGRVFRPDFGDLDAKIIAVDGLYLREPIPAGAFEMTPGNRLDIDIAFNRSPTTPPELWDRFYPARPNQLATFEVEGELVDTPSFASPAHAKVPRWREALEISPMHTFRLDSSVGGPFGISWTFDGVAMDSEHHHHDPSLSLEAGRFTRLSFMNASARLHPIHMHGMFFRLLARNGEPVDEPFFRDTVLVHPRETIDIGLVPTDPGVWMMHCHILEHAESGMMTTIAVRAPSR
jgi:FtsP/CotA-like multicopper oxidase with cupredoxin domain